MATHTAMAQGSNASVRSSFEQRIGILHYVSQKEHGWHGQIRTRFTDFQVHEISSDGEVIHLHDFQTNARGLAKTETSRQSTANTQVPQADFPKKDTTAVATTDEGNHESQPRGGSEQPKEEGGSTGLSQADQTILTDLLGQKTTEELIDLYSIAKRDKRSQPDVLPVVKIAAISDKAQRSKVHSEIRRVFDGKIDTSTESDGSIKAVIVRRSNQQWGNRSRNERSRNNGQGAGQAQDGKFLHFTLYKENRDTMEAINQIARILNLKPSFFGTAGTKDRRAVTTQRVSMRRRNPQSLVFLNNDKIYGVKIGDFKFEHQAIHLGQHQGNEFVIVVKNCHFSDTEDLTFEQKLDVAKSTIDSALEQVNKNGFINYYGTQRFGTHQIGTQEVGMKILKQDFEGAVQALLSFNPNLLETSDPSSIGANHREDAARARACSIFLDTGDAQEASKHLPRRCHVESTLFRHLGRQPKDFLGALLSINRGMRTMYVHAYQSLVWNFAASKRWERFGMQLAEGDLVLIETGSSTSKGDLQNTNDEETIHLVDGESTAEEAHGLKAHALTEEDVRSGKYSIFDVVLPTPGWDVVYPGNEIAQFYTEFMAREENGGLDPRDMLRHQRDFSLPGSYRKLMGKFIGVPSASVRAYTNDTQQLVPTDLDLIRSRKAKETSEQAAARREIKAGPAAWQGFVDNVQENELQASRAKIERRKAESSNVVECQARDTWVQTSVDGSNKRIKVSKQTDVIKLVDENKNEAPQEQTDEMQVDEGATDQPKASEEMQSTNQGGRDPALLPSTLTSQVRTIAENTIELFMAAIRMFTDNDKKVDEDSVHTEAQHNEAGPERRAGDSEPTNGKTTPPIDTTASESETAAKIPFTATDGKIAVIVRFSLNTSQYATVVLRELQGFTPSNGHSIVPASSASPNEDAIDS
ncbi:pseudouridine synthase [Hypoxylon trugodes]|uniref:pseudouridine synthase n=1 Tax=Hypoxylon trugodes TaxID=326681 RepID=UPI002198F61B|nr:pseudouridine synthase [Hypoxylon trugodes]KAI1393420.1 pseudouridine synthase [Hypoxylon trugodes]